MTATHFQSNIPSAKAQPTETERQEAQRLYEAGNAERKQGHWAEAQNLYEQAAALDSSSPAVAARQMLADIMAFRCKDYYNP